MAIRAFVDCGANDGSSVRLFHSSFPESSAYEIHCFEPNPRFAPALRKLEADGRVKFYEAAVSHINGRLPFYLGEPLSSTLRSDKKTGGIRVDRHVEVRAIRLSSWMLESFSPGDEVVLKLDIEGSEYDVLPDLIQTGALSLVSALYGEWHVGKLGALERRSHDHLVRELANRGLKMKEWCAEQGRFEK